MLVESITTTETAEVAPVVPNRSNPERPQEATGTSRENREDVELLKEFLEVAQNHFQVTDIGLDFSVHGDTGRIKVSVTDNETGELIREIPSEQILNLMARLDEMMGILFDAKA
jgi:flagellar protein FlaG